MEERNTVWVKPIPASLFYFWRGLWPVTNGHSIISSMPQFYMYRPEAWFLYRFLNICLLCKGNTRYSTFVEVREELAGIGSPSTPCRLWRLNSDLQEEQQPWLHLLSVCVDFCILYLAKSWALHKSHLVNFCGHGLVMLHFVCSFSGLTWPSLMDLILFLSTLHCLFLKLWTD